MPTQAPFVERLQAGRCVAEIVPEAGGSLAAFYTAATPSALRRDWLRPASAEALRNRSPFDMASFPLLPWCNRIRDGRFEWNGRIVQLAPNRPDSPHTIHGFGWQRPWRVSHRSASSIELLLDETGNGEWPFPFQATQRYALDDKGLSIELAVRNTGRESMPIGLGHHPYLPHRREGLGTRVQAHVEAMWQSDVEVMPTRLSATDPAVKALAEGMPLERFDLDNNFIGFQHTAQVSWPDGSGLTLRSVAPLNQFVLYSPSNQDLFVIEAVSNCTDWLNLRQRFGSHEIGGAALATGETLSTRTELRPVVTSRNNDR